MTAIPGCSLGLPVCPCRKENFAHLVVTAPRRHVQCREPGHASAQMPLSTAATMHYPRTVGALLQLGTLPRVQQGRDGLRPVPIRIRDVGPGLDRVTYVSGVSVRSGICQPRTVPQELARWLRSSCQ